MEWKRGPTIGRGSSATVSIATAAAGNLFAVKSAEASSSSSLLSEEFVISQLNSPFVVKCLGSDYTFEGGKRVFNLFLEYVTGGTLSGLIRSHGGALDETAIQFYAHQLVQGLDYLHGNGLAHCDIKGQNLMIGEEGLKIVDFGCAKWVGEDGASGNFAGTPAYMAPEVARGEDQSFPADIWALGCTVIEMATGSNPWSEMKDPASALYRVGYSGDVPEFPDWLSGTAKDFLGKCLVREAAARWTTAELLQHTFFSSVEANCGEIREITARKSPTSVMDQCFWDAMEVSDSSPTAVISPEYLPAGRIWGLAENSGISDWGEGEDWVTVRGEESSRVNYESEDLNFENWIEEEILGSSIAIEAEEDSFLNCSSDEINFRNFSSHLTISDHFVSKIIIGMEFSFAHFDSLLVQFLGPFLLPSDGIILNAWNPMKRTISRGFPLKLI